MMVRKLSFGTPYLDNVPVKPGELDCLPDTRNIWIGESKKGKQINWILQDGRLIADRVVLWGVAWRQMVANSLASGEAPPINLEGQLFRCRLLEISPQLDEWSMALWAKELLIWASEKYRYFWVIETDGEERRPGRRNSMRACLPTKTDQKEGWLPVLEPLKPHFGNLEKGQYLEVCSNEQIMSGWLHDQTDYDLILRPDPKEFVPDDLDPQIFAADGDMFAISKAGIRIVQRRKEEIGNG